MPQRRVALSSIVVLLASAAWLGGCDSNSNGTSIAATQPDPEDIDDSELYPASACSIVSAERPLTQGADVFTMSLVWDTDHYMFAYVDRNVGAGDIFFLRFGPDGAVQSGPTALVSTPAASKSPRMTKLATGDFLLTWEEGAAPAIISAMVLDPNGTPRGPSTEVAASPSEEARPIVATATQGPVIVWMEGEYPGSQAFIAQFDPAGAFMPGSKKSLGMGTGFPHIATNEMGLGLVFSQSDPAEVATIEFGMLDASLELSARQTLRSPEGDARLARLDHRGSTFIAAWEDFRVGEEEVYMSLVDPAGTRSPDTLVENPGTGSANWPNIASKGDGLSSAIVYYQYRRSRPQIFLANIDSAGNKVGGDLQVSSTPPTANAKYPEIAWSGSNFGVTWLDARDGLSQAYFAAVECP